MPRANVKDKRKAELIAAALDSIAKRGLQETTITHISKGANLSRGIVNFYFNSKEIMLREALKTLLDEYEECWKASLATNSDAPGVRLTQLVEVHFSKKLCQAKRLNMMSAFWGHAASQAAYRNQLEAADRAIEQHFTACLAHVQDCDLETASHLARQLHALIRGLWLSFMLNPQTVDREHLAAEAHAFIDRLTGAPVRIVRDNSKTEPVFREKTPRKPKLKEIVEGQLDIEDLFAVRK